MNPPSHQVVKNHKVALPVTVCQCGKKFAAVHGYIKCCKCREFGSLGKQSNISEVSVEE